MDHNAELDALGLLCPLPVLKIRKTLAKLSSGQVLRVMADDPAAQIDIPHFCHESGCALISCTDKTTHQVYLIRKG